MKTRVLFVLVCMAVSLVVAVPAVRADGGLYIQDIAPRAAASGTTATYTVFGSFYHPLGSVGSLPEFTLTHGATAIHGYDVSLPAIDGSFARVTFAIPATAPAGLYDLHVEQWALGFPYHDTLYDALLVTPRPVIASVDPSSATAGSGALAVTVTGFNFIKIYAPLPRQSVLQVGGVVVGTTVVSDTQLKATVPAAQLASPGNLQIIVINTGTPYDPELQSDPFTYLVKAPSAPVVTACSPTTAYAGYVKNDLVLTVTGSNFVNGSHIMFGATEKTNTTFVSGTQLTAQLTAADLATAGTVAVGVKNPPIPPGAASAATVPFVVQQETSTPVVTISGATDGGWYNAAVPLVFTASDSQSGIQTVQYMAPPAVSAWTAGTSYTVPAVEGAVTVSVQALDWCNLAGTAGITVHIDTSKPGTQTLGNATVKKGGTAKLKYRVTEPAGASPTADVTLKIANSKGKVVKTIPVADAPVNSNRTQSFVCNLAKGTYTWSVYAVDLGGNAQANVATAKLKVK